MKALSKKQWFEKYEYQLEADFMETSESEFESFDDFIDYAWSLFDESQCEMQISAYYGV